MRRLLVSAGLVLGAVAVPAAPASAANVPGCVSVDLACWSYSCPAGYTERRIEWLDTGPVIVLCTNL